MNQMIGICDDEPLILQSLKRMIEECMEKNGWIAEVLIFPSGTALLERISELDIIFLDIEMPDLDGIETGRQILKFNRNCKIIIESGRVDKFKETFKINTFRFITKPFVMAEIEEALQAAWNSNVGTEKIEVYENRIPYSICHKDISYVVSYGSFSEFVVGNKKFRKVISLNELEKILDKNLFFRPNRQYMVNMLQIVRVQNGVIHLKEKNITISKRKKKSFQMAYVEFDLKYGKGR
jgi:DNA-binding LytR/AlgR family response regulator